MKVLVVRFSSIGDIILTTPVVRALKTQLSDCEVHYITKSSFRSLLSANPFIDKIITINESVSEVARELREEKYDYVIDLHHNIRSLKVKLAADGKCYSFPKLNVEKWLLVNLKYNRMPEMHIVDRYFETVLPLGVVNDQKGLDFFLIEGEDPVLPEAFSEGYIAIVIGAKFNTKKYPVQKVRSLCRMLSKPVVLVGGPEDSNDGAFIADGLPNVFNACGKFNFDGSARLVKNASVVVTNDTGFMHISAAFKKPVVSIWGNTVPEFGMYPYIPADMSRIVERNDLSCRPCSKIGYSKCPKGHFDCMEKIAPSDVVKAVNELEALYEKA